METKKILKMSEVLLVRKYLELITDNEKGRELISDKTGSPIHYSMGELEVLIRGLKENN